MNSKKILVFLSIFTMFNILCIGLRLIYPNNISIEIQNNKSDFIQVFFKKNGIYTEENSVRSYIQNQPIVNFELPFGGIPENVLRIDPSNQSGTLIIKNIHIGGLFYNKKYTREDLVNYLKPIQMINQIVLISEGLQINSTGNDPILEFYVNDGFKLQNFSQIIICLFFTIIFFFLYINKYFSKIKTVGPYFEKYNQYIIIFLPIIVTVGIISIFYPGFMSYDTLHALRSARNGVTDSMWPPMVSYIWRCVDLISTNPSAMHFTQVILLLSATSYIIYFMTKKVLYVLLVFIIILIVPAVLGTLAVIWKDVLMASFFLMGFASILALKTVKTTKMIIIYTLIALIFIFLGISTRHNAILAALPLLAYLSYILIYIFQFKRYFLIYSLLIGLLMSSSLYMIKIQLDKYTIPEFNEIKSSNSVFFETVRILDVAGASICINSNLFNKLLPDLTVNDIRKMYDPRHVNLSQAILAKVPIDGRINQIWFNVAFEHPICFLYNKYQMTKFLVGFNSGQQFLITNPSIIDNEYGYKLSDSKIRDFFVNYITNASKIFILKPWFIYLIVFFVLFYLIIKRKLNIELFVLFSSSLLYFGGLVLLGNASDARLPFYTTVTFIIFLSLAFFEIKKLKNNKFGR